MSFGQTQYTLLLPQMSLREPKALDRLLNNSVSRFTDTGKQQRALALGNQALLARINNHFPIATREVGIKRLPSGDIIIQATNVEGKKAL